MFAVHLLACSAELRRTWQIPQEVFSGAVGIHAGVFLGSPSFLEGSESFFSPSRFTVGFLQEIRSVFVFPPVPLSEIDVPHFSQSFYWVAFAHSP